MLWVWLHIVNYFGRQLKTSFWVEKKNLQLEGTFSTSKCSWNIVKIIVENLGFLIVDKHFGVGEPQSPNKLVIHSRLSYGDKCHILWCIGWGHYVVSHGICIGLLGGNHFLWTWLAIKKWVSNLTPNPIFCTRCGICGWCYHVD
jgi:hypothetical protein